jgi:hypothetical protein
MYNSKLPLEQIISNICKDYDVSYAQAKLDVENFLKYFIDLR